MTKEELLIRIWNKSFTIENVRKCIDEFYNSNIVIPKGANRHPYADVYHEAVEGKPLQWSEDGENWFDVVPPIYQYRIKPSEPVYEWQWDTKLPDSTWQYYKLGEQTHFTDDEIGSDANWLCKVEHTKRERRWLIGYLDY